LTTRRAGLALIMISSPVKGLMPLRALVAGFFTTLIFMRPGTVNTPGPRLSSRLIIADRASNTAPTSFLVRPVCSEMKLKTSDLVAGLPALAAAFFLVAVLRVAFFFVR